MTSSTCFRNELRKLVSSTNTLFAPSEKSITLSQNKHALKRIPPFHCSCACGWLIYSWACELALINHSSSEELSATAVWPQGLPQQHLGFPVTQRRRPLSGSHLCTENRFSLWRLKPWKQQNEKQTFLSCFVFDRHQVFLDFKQIRKQQHIPGGWTQDKQSISFPSSAIRGLNIIPPPLKMIANFTLPSYHDSSTHNQLGTIATDLMSQIACVSVLSK